MSSWLQLVLWVFGSVVPQPVVEVKDLTCRRWPERPLCGGRGGALSRDAVGQLCGHLGWALSDSRETRHDVALGEKLYLVDIHA